MSLLHSQTAVVDVRIVGGSVLLSVGLLAVACDAEDGRGPSPYAPAPQGTDDTQAIVGDEFLGLVADAARNAGNPASWPDDAEPESDPEPEGEPEPQPEDEPEPSPESEDEGSCAGFCGSETSSGACYCDSDCVANNDCCSDYADLCAAEPEPEGEAPAGPTCEGSCGGASAEGSCYCDDECVENNDCCEDYADACLVALEDHGDPLDLVTPLNAQANSSACWGIIEIDGAEVIAAAGLVGAAVGTGCVAVATVPAGALAVPTGGLSVGGAAVACGGTAAGGALVGGAASVVHQTLPDIVQCSSEVINSVIRVFPWGRGISESTVTVYTPRPGDCDPDRHGQLQSRVTDLCKNAGQRSCVQANSCSVLGTKMGLASECIDARTQINDECFGGGDSGHNQAVTQERNLHNNCLQLSTQFGC